jgi:hypothetical protein
MSKFPVVDLSNPEYETLLQLMVKMCEILEKHNYILEQLARKAGILPQTNFDEFYKGAKNGE